MAELIPLQGGAVNAHQDFIVQLGDNLLEFRLDWKYTINMWTVNISIADSLIVAGATLQPNVDIIEHWNLSSTIGRLVCVSLEDLDPTLDNIGDVVKLLWYAPDE